MAESNTSSVISYETVSTDYFSKRQLKQGAAGWVLLASLGVSYVISGDFSGWNFGLAQAGFGGMLIATVVMAVMYCCLVFSLAELSAAIPTAGGGYGFARRAMGPWGGFITGSAILLEYSIAPAAIAVFIGHYMNALLGINGPWVYLAFYSVFIGIHLVGVGEALKLMFVITALALLAILVFVLGMLPHFQWANLLDIPINPDALGASAWLPNGWIGIWGALPFAMWLFLAVEGVPLAAEEAQQPTKDMPKGIIWAMMVLLILAGLVLFLAPGGAGAALMQTHGAPLVGALEAVYGKGSSAAIFVNIVGLAGLIASFFSIIFAYSRQVFALSRAGYLPRFLSLTNQRKAPAVALIVPGVLGFGLSLTGEGDLLITMAVFGATISYAMMMLSHILLRKNAPELNRPYYTPGGVYTSTVALLLAIIALISTFVVNLAAAAWSALFFVVLLAYFTLYSRHHLVAQAPEEELAAITQAEAELT
ncbi:ethanolamine permease [Endozoicomonas sp. SM1973]|uniref:Ethanolamine permease n=1 Tax=Spartinivicinus marinus TaxID=2994442 RepID=A0A853ICA6_9GAMM|nr:ethanolamine permease [Spartinivicinus marinus]MCX4029789.1 ethanolamine permease [Spartinivicinus marinus]NYZ67541.1 ethanolamine permease [Spartinivicinus marinus]